VVGRCQLSLARDRLTLKFEQRSADTISDRPNWGRSLRETTMATKTAKAPAKKAAKAKPKMSVKERVAKAQKAKKAKAAKRGKATGVKSSGRVLKNAPIEREEAGNFPAPPIAAIIREYLRDNPSVDIETLAPQCGTTSKTFREILRTDAPRTSLRIATVDGILMGLQREYEWHGSLAPYWLDEAQEAAIEIEDDKLAKRAMNRVRREAKAQLVAA
jgi:hypothetical protein